MAARRPSTRTAQAIVIGAGHNGLICSAYLARSGHDVLLLEARSEVGGLASTVSDLGARFNICNCDHNMIRANPLLEELDLASHGLSYLEPEPSFINMFWSGDSPWLSYFDIDRMLAGLAESRPTQVDGYRRYLRDALPVAELLVEIASVRPTSRSLIAAVLRKRANGAATLLKWSRSSAVDVLRTYFTDDTMVMPALAVGPTVWGAPPDARGTGLAAAGYAMRHTVHTGRPVGGSGALTDAVRDCFTSSGGTVRCNTRVDSLLVESGAVIGVVLDDGSQLLADLVIAACDPRVVLGEWVTGEGKRARQTTARWRNEPVRDGYESKVDAVVDALPRYLALDGLEQQLHGAHALQPTTVIAPNYDDLMEAHRLLPEGRVAENPTLLVNFPSVLDPAMLTDRGHHIMSLESLFTPYAVKGGWPGSGEPLRWMEKWAELVQPGYLDHVIDWRAMTPDKYEAEFEMHRGHTPSYAESPLTALFGRKRELTRYDSPIPGLMLTGAGTYPGAGVWGASGRNASAVASRRLKRS
jgi:phytoene dehydrogenase-like protein